MNSKLIIENVDLVRLDKQRQQLHGLEIKMALVPSVSKGEFEALRAIVNMLDQWSDDRYLDGVHV
jgi:hypothetical protein